MGDKLEVSALVEGGNANGGPPIGPAVGPTGIAIMDVVEAINEKTLDFKGLKVPVTIICDTEDKTFEIVVSTPMTSALLCSEAGIEKGSSETSTEFVGDVTFEQVIKISRMKKDALNALTNKTRVKSVLGTAQSCGIKVDGKPAHDIIDEVEQGNYDAKLKEDDA